MIRKVVLMILALTLAACRVDNVVHLDLNGGPARIEVRFAELAYDVVRDDQGVRDQIRQAMRAATGSTVEVEDTGTALRFISQVDNWDALNELSSLTGVLVGRNAAGVLVSFVRPEELLGDIAASVEDPLELNAYEELMTVRVLIPQRIPVSSVDLTSAPAVTMQQSSTHTALSVSVSQIGDGQQATITNQGDQTALLVAAGVLAAGGLAWLGWRRREQRHTGHH